MTFELIAGNTVQYFFPIVILVMNCNSPIKAMASMVRAKSEYHSSELVGTNFTKRKCQHFVSILIYVH